MKKPEEEVKWLYWEDMQFLRTYLDNGASSDNNQVAEWSSEETEVLINYYQKNECLWNHHIPEYHQAKHKDLLYDILVKELDEKYDVAAIMKKWKQLLKTFREENAKATVKPSGSGTKDIYKPTWEFYEQLKFVDIVCDDTDETSDSLEPKPKSRKLSRQQQQNSREERKLELFSEAVRAIKEPAQLPPPKETLVANDEVAAYANYIQLTMSKFSTRNFRKAKKCIGDILYQIEESEEYDYSTAPALGPVERAYSSTSSSNYSSVSGCQASQYPQGTYYNL